MALKAVATQPRPKLKPPELKIGPRRARLYESVRACLARGEAGLVLDFDNTRRLYEELRFTTDNYRPPPCLQLIRFLEFEERCGWLTREYRDGEFVITHYGPPLEPEPVGETPPALVVYPAPLDRPRRAPRRLSVRGQMVLRWLSEQDQINAAVTAKTLALMMRCSNSTANNALVELARIGYIERIVYGRRTLSLTVLPAGIAALDLSAPPMPAPLEPSKPVEPDWVRALRLISQPQPPSRRLIENPRQATA